MQQAQQVCINDHVLKNILTVLETPSQRSTDTGSLWLTEIEIFFEIDVRRHCKEGDYMHLHIRLYKAYYKLFVLYFIMQNCNVLRMFK